MVNESRVPRQLRAGDTWSWVRTLPDYPAPTWTLTYVFRAHGDVAHEVVASNASGSHSATVSATDSAKFRSGRYRYQGRVTSGALVYTVEIGELQVLPNLADVAQDHRTYNERALEAIEAVRLDRAGSGQGQVTIDDVSITFNSWDEIEQLWQRFSYLVARERGVAADRVLMRL